MKLAERLYWLRLDAALRKRRVAKETSTLENVKCEACLTGIHNYNGPCEGILCSKCSSVGSEGGCTRIMPLAITRSAIND